ncbi:uncharacterized protein LOC135097438 isoform X3 [Scylla paramamosain]|uniref:uncharacterized protein LOC135097438 isoform X3 n=1 Tax=Scylla paramamosain TaxID=85552 RepID=UPI0030836E38
MSQSLFFGIVTAGVWVRVAALWRWQHWEKREQAERGDAWPERRPACACLLYYVLCCSCGAKLTENSWDNFVNISIPLSEASQLVTILGHPHLMVQTLRNPADLAFDLVTVRRSGCSGVGEDI